MVWSVICYRRGEDRTIQRRQMLFRFNYAQSIYQQRDVMVESTDLGQACLHLNLGVCVQVTYVPGVCICEVGCYD